MKSPPVRQSTDGREFAQGEDRPQIGPPIFLIYHEKSI